MISDEEAEAIKAMRQTYDRLKELGWDDIARFKPVMKSFGSVLLGMRLYWPKFEQPSILPIGGGTWRPPAVKRVQ